MKKLRKYKINQPRKVKNKIYNLVMMLSFDICMLLIQLVWEGKSYIFSNNDAKFEVSFKHSNFLELG